MSLLRWRLSAGSWRLKASTWSCARLRQYVQKNAKSLGFDDKLTPKTWGNIPAELQKLPQGAELCGVDTEMGQAVISSPLYGKDIEIFYGPLFAKIGCHPLVCNSGATYGLLDQTRCRCAMPGVVGTIATDTRNEAFTLAISK